MATVFSHIHFCPQCNDTWKCVSWVCEEEDADLTCQPCRIESWDEYSGRLPQPDSDRDTLDSQFLHARRAVRR